MGRKEAELSALEGLRRSRVELETLLALSHQMAGIRDKSDLLTVINVKLKDLFYFTHSSIVLLSKDRQTFRVYLTDFGSPSKNQPDYQKVISTDYPVNDGYFNTILETTEPTVFDISRLEESNQLFEYGKVHRDAGLKEWVCTTLVQDGQVFGVLTFYTDIHGSFTPDRFRIIKGLASQIGVAVSNIVANEEITRRDREKSILVELSHHIATVRDKEGWLRLINNKLKTLIDFSHSLIGVISQDRKTYSGLLMDPDSPLWSHPDFIEATQVKNPVEDNIFDRALLGTEPLVYDIEQLRNRQQLPIYLRINYELGFRAMMIIPMRDNAGVANACLALFACTTRNFDQYALGIGRGISAQLYVALSNILANEEIDRREKETRDLLALNHLMTRVTSREDLLVTINEHVKKLIYFTYSTTTTLSDDGRTFSMFVLDPNSQASSHPDYQRITTTDNPVEDNVFDLALNSDVPVVFNIEELISRGQEHYPSYIRMYYESGIKELVGVPLSNEKVKFGVLALYSDITGSFSDKLNLIKGIGSLISIGASNIIANEAIRLREQERETLLSISHQIAKVRNKNELLILINTQLRKLFYFTHSSISAINPDRKTFCIFITDPMSKSREHARYEELVTSTYPIYDGVFETFIASDEPTISDYESVIAYNPPRYASIQYEAGLREAVSIPLPGDNQVWGVLHFYSDKKNTFTRDKVNIIKGVANQVAVAVSNILAIEEIKRRDEEKTILLELSHDIASVRDKQGWLRLINNKLKKLVRFSHSVIGVISEDRSTYGGFLMDPETPSRFHPDFKKAVSAKNPVNDGVFDKAIESAEPFVCNIAELRKTQPIPIYMQINFEFGYHEMVMMGLRDNQGQASACLALFAREAGSFDTYALGIIKGISAQLYIALSNIQANEEIDVRQQEKENLLAISNEIGKIRDKNELLNFINTNLKTLFPFSYSSISAISADGRTFTQYLVDPASRSRQHPEYEQLIATTYPVNDGVFETILRSEDPTIHRHEEIIHAGRVPRYVRIQYEAGFREAISVPLLNDRKVWGVLHFYSEQVSTFTANYINIIKGVASQVAVAISNIVANEDIRVRDQEKQTLLSISYEIGKVRDKNELLTFINTKLRSLFYFTHSSIAAINDDRETFTVFLTDPGSKSKDHPDFVKMISAQYPIRDGLFEHYLETDEPTISDIEETSSRPGAPRYTQIHYEAGLREAVSIPMHGEKELFGVLTFYSDRKNSFVENNLNIIKGVASQVAVAVSNILAHEEVQRREQEKSLLLSFSNAIATARDRDSLEEVINHYFNNLFHIHSFKISVKDEDSKSHSFYIFDLSAPYIDLDEFQKIKTTKYPISGGLSEIVLNSAGPVWFDVDELMSQDKISFLHAEFWKSMGFSVFIGVPLRVGNDSIGVLWTLANQVNDYILQGISSQIAVSIANILASESVKKREHEKSLLLSFSHEIATVRDRKGLAVVINQYLKNLFLVKEYVITTRNEDNQTHSYFLYDLKEPFTKEPGFEKISKAKIPVDYGITAEVLRSEDPVIFNVEQVLRQGRMLPASAQFWHSLGFEHILGVKLRVASDDIGILWTHPYQVNDNLLKGISAQIAISLANIVANEKIGAQFEEINNYKQQLEQENLYLQQEIETTYNYSEIVGSGQEMQKVYRLLSQVAFANSTVLILGETGTGKELIARAIHSTSPRKEKVMVKVNCAALPANLIESELFGHEKGSFTGAIERRIGKFELANNSTLFLDEIGEMPLELQVKLLRALQEKEIERVGGKTPIKVNVRIIAATNRDLQQEIAEGRFRSDLYYRLNVFPIKLPPLRERREDLPMLSTHFLRRHARNSGKNISGFSAKAMKEMMAYHWPGNIRELEHLIERSILMAEGNTIKSIHLPLSSDENLAVENELMARQTIADVEREYIMKVLRLCNYKIQGIGSAAEYLNIPATTLHSKMKKLGIIKVHKLREQ
jgi:transcriptional regulator with GAF, ATPase, and Fis domain